MFCQINALGRPDRQVGKARGLFPPVLNILIRIPGLTALRGGPESEYQLLGIRKGQRTQQHGIDDAEYRGIAADTHNSNPATGSAYIPPWRRQVISPWLGIHAQMMPGG